MSTQVWQVLCDQEAFENCRKEAKFPYVVALARAVNALTFIRSVMSYLPKDAATPSSKRDRLNSYLFGSAIMYEVLNLIRDMGQTFQDDEMYQTGLRLLLAEPAARQIEKDHLKAVRNKAAFHFDVGVFRETISRGTRGECLFLAANGKKCIDLHYAYADIVAAEILVGHPAGEEEFQKVLADAASKTDKLVTDFINHTEALISYHLSRWGFTNHTPA
jgi:hypothetical protein